MFGASPTPFPPHCLAQVSREQGVEQKRRGGFCLSWASVGTRGRGQKGRGGAGGRGGAEWEGTAAGPERAGVRLRPPPGAGVLSGSPRSDFARSATPLGLRQRWREPRPVCFAVVRWRVLWGRASWGSRTTLVPAAESFSNATGAPSPACSRTVHIPTLFGPSAPRAPACFLEPPRIWMHPVCQYTLGTFPLLAVYILHFSFALAN